MKLCPRCNMQLDDSAAFCPNCGTQFIPNATVPQQPYVVPINPKDHTAEFDPKDISDNKVFAMLPYLASVIGVVIAALVCQNSPYVRFHIRESMKLAVCEILLCFITAVLAFTIIVPIAALVCVGILAVVQIICFFRVCSGKAIETPIIGGFGFFK